METLKAGRVVLDHEGIHLTRFLFVFGSRFDLPWPSIIGWAFGADVVTSRGHPEGQVVQWVIELDVGEQTHVLRLAPDTARSRAVLAALQERLPEQREPRVGRVHGGRLPPAMAKLVGPDHEGGPTPSDDPGWRP